MGEHAAYATRKGELDMAKVYGVHQLQLREGVSGEDLEKYVKEEMAHLHLGEGWESHLLKCDKGDWNGEYLFMAVFESVELRDRLTPGEAMAAETEFPPKWREIVPKWREMMSMVTSTWGDYVVICE
jgi:hypothetical protein